MKMKLIDPLSPLFTKTSEQELLIIYKKTYLMLQKALLNCGMKTQSIKLGKSYQEVMPKITKKSNEIIEQSKYKNTFIKIK